MAGAVTAAAPNGGSGLSPRRLPPDRLQRQLLRARGVLPHADAGMTGAAGHGKTITCELVGGCYRWED